MVISSERPAGWVVLDELDPVVALLAGHYSAAGNARFLEGGHSRGVVVTLADVR